jgi:hypothetical protein
LYLVLASSRQLTAKVLFEKQRENMLLKTWNGETGPHFAPRLRDDEIKTLTE